ncbi:hypothetical protein HY745_09655 [Candidatus Desantisbacteria bacterium]|nr:hypothetical protein [Candidatus Desantisbacteria bacterium]
MEMDHDEYKLLFAPILAKEEIASILSPYGFKDIPKADNNIQLIAGDPLQRKVFAIFFIHLLKILGESPDPDMALNNMEKYIRNVASPVSLFSFFANNLKPLEILILILSHSQFFSDIICINTTYFDWLFESKNIGIAKTSADFSYDINEMLKSVKSFEKKTNILRIFKRREILRIGVNDLIDALSQEAVMRQISLLAETLLEAAYQISKEELQLTYGIPKTPHKEEADFCIISMGKLGGEELNYSSDIDIIFIYSDDGEVENTDKKSQNIISNLDFFTKLAEMIIRHISNITDEGYCFRVDTRLRPDGKSGQLVRSLESMEKYYYSHGETWERQALIKARVAAGDRKLGKTFLKKIDGFIYRKYLDYQAIQEIKMLKNRIEQEVDKKELFEREVKLGYGGIRDIEFTVQFLQLLHGGENEILKNTNTLTTLKNLFIGINL